MQTPNMQSSLFLDNMLMLVFYTFDICILIAPDWIFSTSLIYGGTKASAMLGYCIDYLIYRLASTWQLDKNRRPILKTTISYNVLI